MKKTTLIILFLLVSITRGSSELKAGLKFLGNKHIINGINIKYEKRTTLEYTPSEPLSLTKDFILTFDLAIWKRNFFGYVFLLENNQNQRFVISYYHFGDPRYAYLKFSFKGKGEIYKLPLSKNKLSEDNWLTISIAYLYSQNRLSISKNGVIDTSLSLNLPDLNKCRMISGFSPNGYDVPGMILKDVKLNNASGKRLYHWPLDQSGGKWVRETVQGAEALQKNGIWLRSLHYNWQKYPFLYLKGYRGYMSFTNYDTLNHCFYAFSPTMKYTYNLRTRELDSLSIGPYEKKIAVYYDNEQQKIYGIYHDDGNVFTWDDKKNKWLDYQDHFCDDRHYGGKKFFYNGDLYMQGGYGYYAVRKEIKKYNFEKRVWITVPIKYDSLFFPRSGNILAETGKPGIYYLGFGLGNESGKQEAIWDYLKDLWLLDMNKKTLTFVKKLTTMPDEEIYKEGIYDKRLNTLWMLGSNNNNPGYLRIFRLSLNDYKVQHTAETFTGDYQHFFMDRGKIYILNAFYINKELQYYEMLSLYYPPITEKEYESYFYHPQNKTSKPFLIVFSVLFLVGILFMLYKKKITKKKTDYKNIIINNTNTEKFDKKTVDVQLLNDLAVKKNGTELINEKLLPKNRELLIYLLIHYAQNPKQLIDVSKLTADVWAYLSKDKAKNARTSSLSRLRIHLQSIPELHIQTGRAGWRIYCDIKLEIDYRQTILLIKNDAESIAEIIGILQNGMLLPDDKYGWIESCKREYKNSVINKALEVLNMNIKADNAQIEALAENILLWEPLNEAALRHLLESLIEQKRFGKAKERFDLFNKRYKEIFGEIYSSDMNSLLK